MKNITAGILPLVGAVIVYVVALWDAAYTLETALIILVLLALYLFLFKN